MNRIIILLIVLSGIFFTACFSRNGLKNKKVIIYGSKEYEKFVENAKIKPKEAWKLHFDFFKKKYPNIKRNEAYVLRICIDSDYVFSEYFNMKTGSVSLTGFYVNSQTGEVIFKNLRHKMYRYKKYRFRSNSAYNRGYRGE